MSRLAVKLLLLASLLAPPAPAQEPSPPLAPSPGPAAVAAPAAEPGGSGDTGSDTPRGAMTRFLKACRRGNFTEAAHFLDLRRIPEAEWGELGPELARHLKIVLDRTLWVDLESLADEPDGFSGDGLPPGRDRIGRVKLSGGEADLLLERSAGDAGQLRWRFSPGTVDRIPEMYQAHGHGRLGEWLPEPFFTLRLAEVALWQWLGLLVVLALAWPAARLGSALVVAVSRRAARRTQTQIDDLLIERTRAPLRFLTGVLLLYVGTLFLALSVPAQTTTNHLLQSLAVIAVTWLLARVLAVLSAILEGRMVERGVGMATSLVPLGRRLVQALLAVIATLVILQNLGFNVTALLAGLGVGGLAVALAAQKSVENLFGAVMLVADQPVRVGQLCRFGDKLGTVEAIGLRSTRVRTLDRTLVTVPNAEFANLQLENFASRDSIRLYTILSLRQETSADQLRHLLIALKALLVAHPRVAAEPARVRFVAFGASSLDVEIFAYIETADSNEFLAIREDIYLRMIDLVEASGSGLAFPSQTLYLARDGGLDPARTRAAEQAVSERRAAGKLELPWLPPEQARALDDTLDYPPAGAAVGGG